MFTIDTNKYGSVRIYFRHYRDIGLSPNGLPIKGQTLCIIEQDDYILCTGAAFCSVHDNFNRSVGREIALNRALDVIFWSRHDYEDHLKVSDAYINRKGEQKVL